MAVDRHSVKGRLLRRVKQVFGALHRTLYRRSGGRLGGAVRGVPTLLLTTRGRRSGRMRTVPLVYDEWEGGWLVASSNAGHWEPAWLLNVRADPQVRVEVGRRSVDAIARVFDGSEGARLWAHYETLHPSYHGYAESRGEPIPMVLLEPVDGG